MTVNLSEEFRLLYRTENDYKLPAAPICRQLAAWWYQPLPDLLPPKPRQVAFTWPASGEIDLTRYWQDVDRPVHI